MTDIKIHYWEFRTVINDANVGPWLPLYGIDGHTLDHLRHYIINDVYKGFSAPGVGFSMTFDPLVVGFEDYQYKRL